MKEYITKEQALRRFSYFGREIPKDMVFEVIASLQEEIVRCKDCKYEGTRYCAIQFVDAKPDDFCSYGERSGDK